MRLEAANGRSSTIYKAVISSLEDQIGRPHWGDVRHFPCRNPELPSAFSNNGSLVYVRDYQRIEVEVQIQCAAPLIYSPALEISYPL